MKIALVGASGFVGASVLEELLNRNHTVTAIVRQPRKIEKQHENLTIITGDALAGDNLAGLIAGHDAVISAFNPGWGNPNIYNDSIKGLESILANTKKAAVPRLLVVGGAGSLEVAPGVQLVDTPQFPEEWKQGALAARDFLTTLRKETEQDWTFLSPAIMLQPGERTGKFKVGTDQLITDESGQSSISVQDLAVGLVDELEKHNFSGQRFTLAY